MRGFLLPAVAACLVAAAGAGFAADAGCLLCHSFPLAQRGPGGGVSLQVEALGRAGSAHAKLSCRSCHLWVSAIPHGAPVDAAGCAEPCHGAIATALLASVHGEGKTGYLPCRGCHRREADPSSSGPAGSMGRCLPCHAEGERWNGYLRSPHGRPFASGGRPRAGCPDCHTVHGVLPASDRASSVSPSRISETCRGAAAPGRECHPSSGDAFAGIASGHSSPDEAAAARFPSLRALLLASAALLVLLSAICVLPPKSGPQ